MKVVLESNLHTILKQIDRSELIARRKAAQYLSKRMKKNISNRRISQPGDFPGKYTGNLYKGIGYKVTKNKEVLVGSKSPHDHLLEFGHNTTKSTKSSTKRSFFTRTFQEEQDAMIDIMSEKWF